MEVYVPEVWNDFSKEYVAAKTKSGNALHKTHNQARQKLVFRSNEKKGRILTYELVLIKEEYFGVD